MSVFITHDIIRPVFSEHIKIKLRHIYSGFFRCIENAHISDSGFTRKPWNTVKQCGMSVAVRVSVRD